LLLLDVIRRLILLLSHMHQENKVLTENCLTNSFRSAFHSSIVKVQYGVKKYATDFVFERN
jgi:hypothetical protein